MRHRLSARLRQIQDRQSAMPQNDVTTGRRPEPRAVGAAMPHGLAHPDDEIRRRTTVPGRNAADPAHDSASPPWRPRAAEGDPAPGRKAAAAATRVSDPVPLTTPTGQVQRGYRKEAGREG